MERPDAGASEIVHLDGSLGQRAVLRGTRLDVWRVLETVANHGNSVEHAAAYLDLPVALVLAAIRYGHDNSDEIKASADRDIGAAERAEARWRSEQRSFRSEA